MNDLDNGLDIECGHIWESVYSWFFLGALKIRDGNSVKESLFTTLWVSWFRFISRHPFSNPSSLILFPPSSILPSLSIPCSISLLLSFFVLLYLNYLAKFHLQKQSHWEMQHFDIFLVIQGIPDVTTQFITLLRSHV